MITASFSQTEKAINKSVAESFEANYNADNFDAIFSSFSTEMQNALPLDKTKEFLTGLKKQAGNITKRQFVKYEQTYASYKTNFDRALFAVNISVDKNAKINGLFVKPIKESNLPKLDRNSTKLILPFNNEWTVISANSDNTILQAKGSDQTVSISFMTGPPASVDFFVYENDNVEPIKIRTLKNY